LRMLREMPPGGRDGAASPPPRWLRKLSGFVVGMTAPREPPAAV
jgi:hypothetical protein